MERRATAVMGARARPAWGVPKLLIPHAVGPEGVAGVATRGTLSVRFDTFGVDAQGPAGPLADASVASLLVPLVVPAWVRRVRLTARLRGAVVKSAASRVVIVLVTDGEARVVELPAGRAAAERFSRKLVAECPVQSDGHCAATLCVHGVRATTADAVMASVESLSVRVEPVDAELEERGRR